MRKVYSHFNPAPMKYEQNSGISLTEPDQSMTLDEIIQAFMEGVQVDPDSDAFYDGDDDLDTGAVDNYDDVLDALDHAPEKVPENAPEKEPEKAPEKEPEKAPDNDEAHE